MSITATIGIAAAISAAAIHAHSAGEAAQAQETAAQQAGALEKQNQQAGINFQTQEWQQQQQAEQPYQQLGQTSANAYANMINNPFTAPTLAQAEQTPGYQFNLQSGTQAIGEQAAATGNLQSGNTGVALEKYGQGLATNTYQQAYQNALSTYQTNLNAAGQGVNVGLTSTGQLGQFGQSAANNLSNLYLTGGQQQASQINNRGAAQAAGIVGQGNAWANGVQGAANAYTSMAAMNGGYGGGINPPSQGFPSFMPQANPYAGVQAPAPYDPMNLPAGSFQPPPSF